MNAYAHGQLEPTNNHDVTAIPYSSLSSQGRPANTFALVESKNDSICNTALTALNEPIEPAFVNQPIGEIMVASRLSPRWERLKFAGSPSAAIVTINLLGSSVMPMIVRIAHFSDVYEAHSVYFLEDFVRTDQISRELEMSWIRDKIVRSNGKEYPRMQMYLADIAEGYNISEGVVSIPFGGWHDLIGVGPQFFSILLDWRFSIVPNPSRSLNDNKTFGAVVFRSFSVDKHERVCVFRTKIRVIAK